MANEKTPFSKMAKQSYIKNVSDQIGSVLDEMAANGLIEETTMDNGEKAYSLSDKGREHAVELTNAMDDIADDEDNDDDNDDEDDSEEC